MMAKRVMAVALSSVFGATGCGAFAEAFGRDDTSDLHVFVTHHATPDLSGVIPHRGAEGEERVFTTDEGWTVTLTDAFVTTRAVVLQTCAGKSVPLELYWGPVAEDLHATDLDLFTVGGVRVEAAEFCGLTVEYGPFDAEEGTAPRAADKVDGTTVYLTGYAEKGDEIVGFEVRTADLVSVQLDLSSMQAGSPFRVRGDEPFPVELTLAKTYDRFFDGIDFGTLDEGELAEQVLAVLALETRVDPSI